MTTNPTATTGYKAYNIYVSKDHDYNPKSIHALTDLLLSIYQSQFLFQIAAESGQVYWRIIDIVDQGEGSRAAQAIHGVYPEADIEEVPFTLPGLRSGQTFHVNIPIATAAQSQSQLAWYAPIANIYDDKEDAMTYAIQAMAEATKNGTDMYLTMFIEGEFKDFDKNDLERQLRNEMTSGVKAGLFVMDMVFLATSKDYSAPNRTPPPPNEFQRLLIERINGTLFKTYFSLEAYGSNSQAVGQSTQEVTQHLFMRMANPGKNNTIEPLSAERVGQNAIRQLETPEQIKNRSFVGYIKKLNERPELKKELCAILSPTEVALLWHLPHKGMTHPGITFVSGSRPDDNILKNQEGIVIGQTRNKPIRLPDHDRKSHTYIIGKNGVGKSSLMLNMIRQDIERGKGVGVIDPDGRLVNDILLTAIPDNRRKDVIVLDLAETKHPVPLNPFNIRDSEGRIASGLFADMLRRIYPEFDRAERAKSFLMGALGALNFAPDPIISDVVKLFEDAEFREQVVNGHVKQLDKGTYKFWRTYAALSSSNKRDYPYPVTHRLNSLISVEALQPILCHPQTINWAQVMRENRIVLVSLNPRSDTVGEQEQQLIGTIALSMIHSAARNHGERQPFDFYLYIDEVQRFINTSLPRFFEGIRKFGVFVTVANQFLSQLETSVLDSIIGNVGATFIFEVGDTDARRLKTATLPGFDDTHLMGLGKFHPVVRMRLNERNYPAFDIRTIKPQSPSESERANAQVRANEIRDQSIRNWTSLTSDEIVEGLNNRDPQEPIIWDRDDDERIKKNQNRKTPPKTDKTDPTSWGNEQSQPN